MKMELTEGSETSAYINQTPGNYTKGNLLYVFLLCVCVTGRVCCTCCCWGTVTHTVATVCDPE